MWPQRVVILEVSKLILHAKYISSNKHTDAGQKGEGGRSRGRSSRGGVREMKKAKKKAEEKATLYFVFSNLNNANCILN